MEELKKIKKSNIRMILAIILVILSSISIIMTYDGYLKAERERIKNANAIHNYIERFNSKFASLAGKNKTAAMVKTLYTNIITNNAGYADDVSRQVFVKEGDISQLSTREEWKNSGAYYIAEDIAKLRDKIFVTTRYNVEICYEDRTGLVMGIGITTVEDVGNNVNEPINVIKPLGSEI